MKAVVSVIGKDRTGIIAAISSALAELNVNIEDISQTIMHENFVMIMLVNTDKAKVGFDELTEKLRVAALPLGVTVHVQHEDIFNAMHKV